MADCTQTSPTGPNNTEGDNLVAAHCTEPSANANANAEPIQGRVARWLDNSAAAGKHIDVSLPQPGRIWQDFDDGFRDFKKKKARKHNPKTKSHFADPSEFGALFRSIIKRK